MASDSKHGLMDVPAEFFMGEERDGFYIPGMMKKAWAVHIQNYKRLESVCSSLGIHCSPTWGSMLGAVREGGIIPWDDDIDTEMLREDYEKLKQWMDSSDIDRNNNGYHLRDYHATGEDNMVRSWWDSEKNVLDPEQWSEHYGFPYASAIDIFLLDHIPEDEKKRKEFKKRIEHFVLMKSAAQSLYGYSEDQGIDEARFEQMLEKLSDETGVDFSKEDRETLWIRILECEEEYISSIRINGVRCDDVAMIPYFRNNDNRIVKQRAYDFYIEMPFEYTTVSVPIGYDDILRRFYGDYSVPNYLFNAHGGYPFYQRSENILKEEFGIAFFRYEYDAEAVKNVKSGRKPKISLKDELDEVSELFHEAHAFLITQMNTGKASVEEILGVLEQCQALAVRIGELLELRAASPKDMVGFLEDYCEYVYNLYQKIIENKDRYLDLSEDIDSIREYDRKIKQEVFDIAREIKQILFLPYHPKYWNGLHTMWERYEQDPGFRVSVIPVPYYLRSFDGAVNKDSLTCVTEGYPDDVVLTNYDEYDVEAIHPDMIIYQNPYDEYEEAISIHPYFYSSNLYAHTEQMVFVPPFELREVEEEDVKAHYTLGCYLRNPGIVYADRIYAQSEEMKKVYIDILTEFTGEKKTFWEGKIIGEGLPITERKKRVSERHDSEAEKLNKTTLFFMSVSPLYMDGMIRIDKAKKQLSYIRDSHPGIEIIWYEDPCFPQVEGHLSKDVLNEYMKLKEEFSQTDNSRYAITEDESMLVTNCDMFIGDIGRLMNQCRIAGKEIVVLPE